MKKIKLKTFTWEGIDKQGNKQQDEIKAINSRIARAALLKNNITVTKIRRQFFTLKKKIHQKEIIKILRSLLTLFSAGIPLLNCLESIENSNKKKTVKELLKSIKEDVKNGNALSHALEKHSRHFNPFICYFISVGEQSGTLETLLAYLLLHLEKTMEIKSKIKKALLYPTVVISIALIVTFIMLIFVIPQFGSLFSSMGAALPWPTQVIIASSQWIIHYGYIFLLLLIIFIVSAIILKKKYHPFQCLIDRLMLQCPFIGNLLKKSIVARFSRTIAITFSAGIPIMGTLDHAKSLTNNSLFYQAIAQAKRSITQGESLHHALKKTRLFQEMVLEMVDIGEEAGKLSEMLEKIADIYESEIDQIVDGIHQLLEPIIMAILGIIIGGLVIAMYLPIFKLGTVIS